jgi:hypothetical protein
MYAEEDDKILWSLASILPSSSKGTIASLFESPDSRQTLFASDALPTKLQWHYEAVTSDKSFLLPALPLQAARSHRRSNDQQASDQHSQCLLTPIQKAELQRLSSNQGSVLETWQCRPVKRIEDSKKTPAPFYFRPVDNVLHKIC